jgi:cation:H+ antiporter
MEILQWLGIFIVALLALLKSAQWFTDSAEHIGLHYKLSPFIIGVTIIALGTSLPEISTSIISVLQGHSEIVIGNVIGSNIANILLVLGITAIAGKHLKVNKNIIMVDLPFLIASAIMLFLTTYDGQFTIIEGILSLLGLGTYLLYNAKCDHKLEIEEEKAIKKLEKVTKKHQNTKKLSKKYPLYLLLSGTLLYFSANYTIESVVKLGEIFNIGTEIIAMSAIAIGTSLPELMVSVVAAKNGKTDIAIGNITGSNIFNALAVMGIPSLFGPLSIPTEVIYFHIPAMILITIYYVFVTMEREIFKWEGMMMVLLYAAFMLKTFGLI